MAATVATRTLARIERGQQTPSWSTFERICEVLAVSTITIARRWTIEAMDVPDHVGSVPGLGIRPLRRARGLTLVRLSELTGVSVSTLSRFERGITASRLLVDRPGWEGRRFSDRDQVLSSRPLAKALGFDDLAGLRAACDDPGEGEDDDDYPPMLLLDADGLPVLRS